MGLFLRLHREYKKHLSFKEDCRLQEKNHRIAAVIKSYYICIPFSVLETKIAHLLFLIQKRQALLKVRAT